MLSVRTNTSNDLLSSVSACLLLAAAMLTGCQSELAHATAASEPPVIHVGLAAVERGDVDLPVRGFGRLEAHHALDLAFKVSGIVTRVLVDDGAVVKRGQLLASLDATELDAQVRSTRLALDKAVRDRQRTQLLVQDGAAPRVGAQDAETGVNQTRANLDVLVFNLRHTQLLAPEDGLIETRMIEQGEVIAPGRPAFHMSCTADGPIVRMEVADQDSLALREHAPARVTFDVAGLPPSAAHVSRVARSATPATGTYSVELTLDDPAASRLPLGLTLKAEIERIRADTVSVPVSALVDSIGQNAAVYVIEAGRAKRVPVRIDQLHNDRALLETPLSGVENVIDRGAHLLRDGARIAL